MLDLGPAAWALLAVAALMVGFAKTAVGGVAAISGGRFAAVLPARESTGVLLPLLLVGDVSRSAPTGARALGTLLRLFPAVVVGVLVGVVFVDRGGRHRHAPHDRRHPARAGAAARGPAAAGGAARPGRLGRVAPRGDGRLRLGSPGSPRWWPTPAVR